MNQRNNRYAGSAGAKPWTPEWLRRTSPAAVVAMAEHHQRTEEPDRAPTEAPR